MCPSNSPFVEVFAPFDRARIGAAATADADSVEHALTTAYGLYRDRHAWLPLAVRIRILEKAQELMVPRAETLAVEAAREGGKPLVDSRVEIARAIDSLRICVETLHTDAGEVIPMNVEASSEPTACRHASRRRCSHAISIPCCVAIRGWKHRR